MKFPRDLDRAQLAAVVTALQQNFFRTTADDGSVVYDEDGEVNGDDLVANLFEVLARYGLVPEGVEPEPAAVPPDLSGAATADPNECFVVTQLSRAQIAVQLNEYLTARRAATTDRLRPDDERLTGAVCRRYTADLDGLDPDQTIADQDEYLTLMHERALATCGIATARLPGGFSVN